ncbi:MotA/TolQ/ExbB proton channel family protein [Myxococcota bacterium]|nr:MotA/TolQ/ExbB proton channel family protein [Myxococcota bacterium]
MLEPVFEVRDFIERGGDVLYLILGVTFLMWLLIIERFWYFRWERKRDIEEILEIWNARADQTSWYAQQIRTMLISDIETKLSRGLLIVKTLVALCPLLGLLGTVTGMIEVFDVMAISGSGNARAMASGVSKATIPTMSGMVAALSGLVISVQMERFARDEAARVADHLTHA